MGYKAGEVRERWRDENPNGQLVRVMLGGAGGETVLAERLRMSERTSRLRRPGQRREDKSPWRKKKGSQDVSWANEQREAMWAEKM